MRDFKGMKRQRGRNRGGNAGGGGNGGKPQHNVNRAFDSNGPDGVKIRGNAQHVFEKYQQLARNAAGGGDRVLAEGYLQHAEHYFRVLRAVQPQRPPSDFLGRETFASGYDIDFEEEPQPGDQVEGSEGDNADGGDGRREWSDRPQNDRQQNDRQQNGGQQNGQYDRPQYNDRQQNDRPRDDNRPRDDYRARDDRPQNDRQQNDRPQNDRPQNDGRPREDRFRDQPRYRDDRPRDENRPRDDRPRDERPRDQPRYRDDRPRNDRPERDPLGVVEPQATPLTPPAPAYEPPEPTHGVLRSEDGGVSHAPAFLQQRAAEPRPADADEPVAEARRPRRRRAPRTFDAAEGAAPAESDEG